MLNFEYYDRPAKSSATTLLGTSRTSRAQSENTPFRSHYGNSSFSSSKFKERRERPHRELWDLEFLWIGLIRYTTTVLSFANAVLFVLVLILPCMEPDARAQSKRLIRTRAGHHPLNLMMERLMGLSAIPTALVASLVFFTETHRQSRSH